MTFLFALPFVPLLIIPLANLARSVVHELDQRKEESGGMKKDNDPTTTIKN